MIESAGIRLDHTNMTRPALGGGRGIDPARFEALAGRFRELHARVDGQREAGELGFYQLPYDTAGAGEIERFAQGPGQAFEAVVVLGIGGSALGATALRTALLHPFWNELGLDQRDGYPRLYVLDNADPVGVRGVLERVELGRTLFLVVSKSGGTPETMSQFLIVRERLERQLGEAYRGHLLFVTDPEQGVLRRLAREEGVPALAIAPNVGGRFSVLSPVGLVPAALVGIDVQELLAGAREMDQSCRGDDLGGNPAGGYAALQYLADTELGASVQVMMPYADRLSGVADWFCQLWAESLGKRRDLAGNEVFAGPTPVSALGPADQHSQVQLYIEGPFDKTVTLLAVREREGDLEIPRLYGGVPELAYLGGHTLGGLLDAEREATADALAREGRMNMTVELPRVDARSLGGLLFMLEVATVYAGGFYRINPMDQPGVELGKRLTYQRMGREGY